MFSPHNSKRGKGRGIVTGEKRQKQLIKGRRRTGSSDTLPPSPPHPAGSRRPSSFTCPHLLKLTQGLGLSSRVEGEGGRAGEKRRWRPRKEGEETQAGGGPGGAAEMTGGARVLGASP